MPSPVGHTLIGLALGSAWLLPRVEFRKLTHAAWEQRWPLLGCVALANLPDLDYVPGVLTGEINLCHHYYTHTPGWCLLVAAGLWLLMRARGVANARAFFWLAALLLSHLAADIFCEDGRAPQGIMALWPFNETFYISPVSLFTHLRKDEWTDILQWHNVYAVLREAVVCAPFLALAVWTKTRRPA